MGRSFSRASPRFLPQPSLLILCEDSKSCLTYLQEAAQVIRAQVSIKHCATCPLKIVQEAKRLHKQYDHIYCVIDRDEHEHFKAAQDLAQSLEKVEIIASWPCFEFWLLLHFRYSRKAWERSGKRTAAEQLLSELHKIPEMKEYEKGRTQGLFQYLGQERLARACAHAEKTCAAAKLENAPNPSTELHLLLQKFRALAHPQALHAD